MQTVQSMPLPRLAQTTHAHLLGFAMLFALTGLTFSFTSYPQAVRVVFAPLPLLAQVVEIGCWWLGRIDPLVAQLILVSGGLAAFGLAVQVLGGLWDLFGKAGRILLVVVLLTAGLGGGLVKLVVIDPALGRERTEFRGPVR